MDEGHEIRVVNELVEQVTRVIRTAAFGPPRCRAGIWLNIAFLGGTNDCAVTNEERKRALRRYRRNVHHTATRFCTGAFQTSPTGSLRVESAEPPLRLRRVQLNVPLSLAWISILVCTPFGLHLPLPHCLPSLKDYSVLTAVIQLRLMKVLPTLFDNSPIWRIPIDTFTHGKRVSCHGQRVSDSKKGVNAGQHLDGDIHGAYARNTDISLHQWFLTWVRSNPRGSVSQSQGFGGDQETHLTHMICDGTPCCPSLLQMIMLHHLANLCCREFDALNSRLVTVVMVKRARFDEKATLPVFGFVPINKPVLTALYEVAYLIAKQGKPLTIGETLVKPAVLKMANIMLGEETEVKLSQIPLSNGTISDRIEDMSKDILAQVFADLISKPAKSSLQLDETTDVSNLSQLAILVRYVKDDVLNEDFLFCMPLTTTTKAAEVKKRVDNFFKDNILSWDMVSAVCSDRVPVTLGRKSGFGAVVKADAPHIIVTHCILHRHALATKTLPPKLAEVLKIVDCVNYMQSSALRHRIFSGLCKEMGSEFEVLLYHSNIQWLSRGQVLNRVFAMRVELALFLQEHQQCHADCFKN
ncbi:hypothetical protein FHG87_013828 [Trinorchestia longiramus]|nr:hypothetical protein FHG87_013828 [Trinorchestia longiramus]